MVPLPSSAVVAIAAAYLCGSIPFGLLVGKWFKGIDLREHGSRNIGATNAGRVLGAKWGVAVLLLDALKGLLPTWLLPWLVGDEPVRIHVQVGCGVAAILGHMFPCWLGVITVLAPWGTAFAFPTFVVVFALSRIVSLSSIAASLAFGIAQMVLLAPQPFGATTWSLGVFSLAAPLMVIVRHRDNIGRLLRGEEKRYRTGERGAPEGTSSHPTSPSNDEPLRPGQPPQPSQ
jgi:glycerol-3-phosphate acyltransferase PlsY